MAFSAGAGSNLGSASGEIRIDVAAAQRNLKQLQGSVQNFASSSEGAFNRLATGLGLLAGSRAIAGIFSGAVGTAADFEAAISAIGAVADATGAQMDDLRAKALQLGADTSFSASEAAAAIEELAKAGLPVEAILSGAADGAVALAAAAGISLPQAAITMANAINIFGLSADQAVHVADVFAAAANKSAADADGLAQAIAQVGTVADQFGVSLDDTVGALALFADNGLKGSDAGTSLKTALTSMLTPMGEGANEIERLGLNFRNATGEFVGIAGAADELRRVLGPLGVAERETTLRAIFGQDALRVGAILYGEGGDAVREYTTAVNDSGAAQRTAKKRLDNFNGALEQLRGSIETAAIVVGAMLLPALKEIVEAVTLVVNAFVDLPGPVQAVLAGLVGASGVIAGIAGVIVLAGPKMAAFGEALTTIRTALLGFAAANPIILAVVAALALFGLAYAKNFGGFADFVDSIAAKVKAFADTFIKSFRQTADLRPFGNLGAVFVALGTAIKGVTGLDVVKQFINIGKTANRIGVSLGRMRRQFGVLGRAFERGGLREGFEALFGDVGQKLLNEFGDLIGALPRTVGTALRQITTGIVPLDNALHNLGTAFVQFGRFIENVFAGDFDKALANFKIIGQRLKLGAINVSNLTVRIASWAFETAIDLSTAVLAFVTDDLWPQVRQTAADVAGYIVSISEWAVEEGTTLAGDVASWITDTAWPAVRDAGTDVTGFIVRISDWVISAGSSILTAVTDAVQAAWALVRHLAVDLGSVVLNVLGWAVRTSASIWDAVDDTVQAAWKLVKGTAIDIADAAVNVVSWVTDQLEAGTLVSSVQAFIEAQLATINVFMDSWTLTVGAPGEDQITVDVGAIFGAIWDALTVPLVVDPVNAQKAEEAGRNFGEKAVEFIVGAIHDFFLPGGGAEGESDKIGIDQVAVAFFSGLLGGINDALDEALTAWLGEPSQVGGKIVAKLKDVFVDPFTEMGGPQSAFMETVRSAVKSIMDAIGALFTTNPLDTVTFPDLVTPVTTWFGEQITAIKEGLIGAIPEWMKALANGDVLGAVKSLFGDSGGTGASDAEIAAELANLQAQARPSSGGGAAGGGFSARPFFESGTTFGEAIGDGIIAGIGNKQDDVATALRNLVNPPSDTGTGSGAPQTTPKAPEPIKLPAPDTSALLKGFADARRATVDAMRGIGDDATRLVGPLRQAAQTATQGYTQGLRDGFSQSIQAARDAVTGIRNALNSLGSLYEGGKSIGASLGQGIVDGLDSQLSAVRNAAAALILAAHGAAEATGEIGSPSKLFAREIGLPIAQGMAVGISDGTRTVQRSIADLIGASVPQTSAAMLGRQPVGVAATGARGGNTIIVVNAVKSDEMVNLLRQAERGSVAMDVWDDYVGRAPALVFGGAI